MVNLRTPPGTSAFVILLQRLNIQSTQGREFDITGFNYELSAA